MKGLKIALVAGCALLLTGCIVPSDMRAYQKAEMEALRDYQRAERDAYHAEQLNKQAQKVYMATTAAKLAADKQLKKAEKVLEAVVGTADKVLNKAIGTAEMVM